MAIKFEGVTYNFNKKKLLDNVNLEIEDNKITGIIGKTGSGKTFLASLLSAINVPISGTITVKGFIFGKNSNIKKLNEYRKIIGYSFQNPREQFLCDTVENELILTLKNYNYSLEQIEYKKKELCELFNFNQTFLKKSLDSLSSSEERMVSIAASIAHNPDLIILDEPTNGLDAASKKLIINIIKKLKQEYLKTIIVISHDVDLLIKFVDDVVVMDSGKVVMYGKKMDVFSNVELFKKYNIELPTIIKFSDMVKEKKGKKIGYYDDIKDLMKAVYRNV